MCTKLGRIGAWAKDYHEHPMTNNMETKGDLQRGDSKELYMYIIMPFVSLNVYQI